MKIKAAIDQKRKNEKEHFVLNDGDIAVAYKLKEGSQYDQYLNDNRDKKKFIKGMLNASEQLGIMARDGDGAYIINKYLS